MELCEVCRMGKCDCEAWDIASDMLWGMLKPQSMYKENPATSKRQALAEEPETKSEKENAS